MMLNGVEDVLQDGLSLLPGEVLLWCCVVAVVVAAAMAVFVGIYEWKTRKRKAMLAFAAGISCIVIALVCVMTVMVLDRYAPKGTIIGATQEEEELIREVLEQSGADISVVRVGGYEWLLTSWRYAAHYNPQTKGVWVRDGFVGEEVLWHEMGHALWAVQNASFKDAWKRNWGVAMEQERVCAKEDRTDGECALDMRFKRFVSEYARTDVEEDFADSFAAYKVGKDAGAWREELIEVLQ